MKERPIPFNAPMIRAVLAGDKTQTRRIAMPVKHPDLGNLYAPGALVLEREPQHVIDRACPYGQPGDRLWVREPWRSTADLDKRSGSEIADLCLDAGYSVPWAPIQYEADGARRDWKHTGTPPHDGPPQPGRYRHARFMPRWACRLVLEVTRVRVERLQAINHMDALAEGVGLNPSAAGLTMTTPAGDSLPRVMFRALWEQINGAGAWDANPWVWVVEFRRLAAPQSDLE
ncbi:hypothetical protein B9P52_32070 [Achromobacter denitrificans]|uniref:hypothetical protein n=1 Tax=Achromobacter denitrificans TaxID=32002 RepID=UPI000B4DBD71|nr:hypothetical protein [Achromobacter denitrificans]ASC68630.1 hypothetical protein B9P52_32070 [Achromobacter denitrificans]GFN25444.1 hypothetical protein ADE_11420 [Achromobacter denitrificans]